jgi:hypothetical protein
LGASSRMNLTNPLTAGSRLSPRLMNRSKNTFLRIASCAAVVSYRLPAAVRESGVLLPRLLADAELTVQLARVVREPEQRPDDADVVQLLDARARLLRAGRQLAQAGQEERQRLRRVLRVQLLELLDGHAGRLRHRPARRSCRRQLPERVLRLHQRERRLAGLVRGLAVLGSAFVSWSVAIRTFIWASASGERTAGLLADLVDDLRRLQEEELERRAAGLGLDAERGDRAPHARMSAWTGR